MTAPTIAAGRLRVLADRVDKVLAGLPLPTLRNDAQRLLAEDVQRSLRDARNRFLAGRVREVYDTLTDDHRRRLRLSDLVDAAQTAYPGLVPTGARLTAERDQPQADKDGAERDLGVFFGHVLRHEPSGIHLMETMQRATPRAARLLADFRRTGVADLGGVRLERRDGVAHLTMWRPDCLNAEDDQQVDDMETAVDLALSDPAVRVGVLRGGPMTHPRYAGRRVFSSGINLKALHAGRISLVDFLLRRELGYLSKLVRGLIVDDDLVRPVQKPWIAAIDTFAIGGGMQIALTCDRVVAGADSYLSLPAAQEGIVPGAANLRLGRLVGGRIARRIILEGRRIQAAEPAADMLVDEVVDPREVGAAAQAAAERYADPAVAANRRMLVVAEEPADAFRRYLAEFAVEQSLRLCADDVVAKAGRFNARTDA
jgi:thioesterase DpgC